VLLELARRFKVRGVLRDPEGGVPTGRLVLLRFRPGSGVGPVLDRFEEIARMRLVEPSFETLPLPVGRYRLRAEADDGRVAAVDVNVTDAKTPPVVLSLDSGVSVRGRVVAGAGVRSIADAEVRLMVAGRSEAVVPQVNVDRTGVFTLRGVPPGEHDLVALVPGHAPVVLRNVSVAEDGGIVDVGDLVVERGTSLRVRVLNEERRPSPDVSVLVVDDAGLQREETTGSSGVALFGGLRGGAHVIEVRLAGGARYRRPVDLPGDGEVDEEFDFGLGTPGEVRIRRGSGPVPGAAVRVLDSTRGSGGYAASVEVRTDDHGAATVPSLPEGPVLLEVTPPGEPSVRLSAIVMERFVEVDLPTDGIAGEVRSDEKGEPVPGARIHAYPEESDDAGAVEAALHSQGVSTVSNRMGRFEFPSLPEGRWTLVVEASGRGTVEVESVAVIVGGGPTRIRVLLPLSGSEATDPNTGVLVPGGRLVAGAGGRYHLDGLAPGAYVLTARAGAVGASAPRAVTLAPGESVNEDLHLLPGGTLVITTVGLRAAPVSDAVIEVEDALGSPVPLPDPDVHAGSPMLRPGRTGPGGVLRVPGLRSGVYVVRAWKPGLEPAEVRVRIMGTAGGRAVLTLLPPAPPTNDE
jgi:hypothetical protein